MVLAVYLIQQLNSNILTTEELYTAKQNKRQNEFIYFTEKYIITDQYYNKAQTYIHVLYCISVHLSTFLYCNWALTMVKKTLSSQCHFVTSLSIVMQYTFVLTLNREPSSCIK